MRRPRPLPALASLPGTMRALGLVAAAAALACTPQAAAESWTRSITGPRGSTCVASTVDGGAVFAGGNGRLWVAKVSTSDTFAWQTSFEASGVGDAHAVAVAPDGAIFVTGAAPFGRAWLAKLDADGALSWMQEQRAATSGPSGLVALADGGAIVVGRQPWLWRVDAAGATASVVELVVDGSSWFDGAAPTPDGGVVLAGGLGGFGGNTWFVRLDALGAIASARSLDVAGSAGSIVASASDGGLFAAIVRLECDDDGCHSGAGALKLDADLDPQWGTWLPVDLEVGPRAACQLADGAFALGAGATPSGDPPRNWFVGSEVVVLEPDGTLRWAKGFANAIGEVSALAPTIDGGAFVAERQRLRRLDAAGLAGDSCHGEVMDLPIVAQPFLPIADTLVASLRAMPSDPVAIPTTATDTAATLVPAGDVHEPDDTCAAARTLRDDQVASLDFCDDPEDWFELVGCAGVTYDLTTSALGAQADTVVEIHAPGCGALLASDDDGGGGRASRLAWTAAQDGVYRVRVRQADGTWGPDRGYELRLATIGACGTWMRALAFEDALLHAEPRTIRVARDGTIVVAGMATSDSSLGDAFAVQLDASGRLIRSDLFNGTLAPSAYGDLVDDVQAMSSGELVLAGRTGVPFESHAFVTVMNASGSFVSHRSYVTSAGIPEIRRLLLLSDGGRALVGGIASGGAFRPWIVRFAPDGSVAWSVSLDATDTLARSDAVEIADGGLLVISPTLGRGGLLVSDLAADGSVRWQRLQTMPLETWPAAIVRADDGGVLLSAGDTVLRLGAGGDVEWSTSLWTTDEWMDARAIAPSGDGGCVVAGATLVGGVFAGRGFVARLDASGHVAWQRATWSAGAFTAVARTPDLGFVAVGDGGIVVKMSGTGEVLGGCAFEEMPSWERPGRRDTVDDSTRLDRVALTEIADALVEVASGASAPLSCAGGLQPSPVELCLDGADDDMDGLIDCMDSDCDASDVDGDGAFDCADCAPFDGGAREVPGDVEDLRVVKLVPDGFMVHMTWSDSVVPPAGDEIWFDVTSGSIATLHASGWPSTATCIGNDVSQFDRYDMRPSVTECWWLVRPENACGVGPWGGPAEPVPDCP